MLNFTLLGNHNGLTSQTKNWGKNQNYSITALEECVNKLKNGMLSKRKASTVYEIPRSTIQNKMKWNHMGQVGRKPVFTDIDEDVFTTCVELFMFSYVLFIFRTYQRGI